MAIKYYSNNKKATWDDVATRYNHIRKYTPHSKTSASWRIQDFNREAMNPVRTAAERKATFDAAQRVTAANKKKKR